MGSRSNKEARSRGSSSPGSPGIGGAIRDAASAIGSYRRSSPAPVKAAKESMGSGIARKGAETLSGRQAQIERQLRDAGA